LNNIDEIIAKRKENSECINIVNNTKNYKYRTDNRKFNENELAGEWKMNINRRIASNIYLEEKERMKMEPWDFLNKI